MRPALIDSGERKTSKMMPSDRAKIEAIAEKLLERELSEGKVLTPELVKQCVADAAQAVAAADSFICG